MTIKLIQGDVLEVVPTLVDERFDLVIADPPAEMSQEDIISSLWMAYDASSDDAVLFLYGVTAPKLIQLANKAGWRVRGMVFIASDRGVVVAASKVYPNVNHEWIANLPWSVNPAGSKGTYQHETTKPRDWFQWIFTDNKWSKVLDIFAGLAPVGHICYDAVISYVGIELDEEAVKLSGIL